MQLKKLANGVEFIPETEFEKECIQLLAGKALSAKFEDAWDQKGPLQITYEKHPWDNK